METAEWLHSMASCCSCMAWHSSTPHFRKGRCQMPMHCRRCQLPIVGVLLLKNPLTTN